MILSAIILIVSLVGNYKKNKELEEDYISVDRTPLQPFRLIDYKETDDGVFIDIVSTVNGSKYTNNFISKVCPYGKEKKLGMIMQLSIIENIRTLTQEKFYTLDRAYEYLCTNLNMEEEDKKLFQRIEEAKKRAAAEYGIVITKANKQQK